MRISFAVAVALLLLHAAFVAFGPRPREARFQSGDQLNEHVIGQYAQAPARGQPPVVLVGSSMTARLSGNVDDCAYNLALTGESSTTGLSVLEGLKAAPRVVLAEINVPERRINRKLVGRSVHGPAAWISALAPQNMPANLLFSFLSDLRTVPAQPGKIDDAALEKGLAVQRQEYAREIPPAVLGENMAQMAADVQTLERAGSQVVFFELPIHPSLEDTPRAAQIRAAFVSTFPGRRLLRSADLANGSAIRTIDGVHLGLDEGVVVSRSLRAVYAGACVRPPEPRTATGDRRDAVEATRG
jgi:hypothetical protein